MASVRDIRRKIRVVKNISQITQAMKMVAAAKLRRVQERVEKGKPYSQTMAELVGTLAPHVREFNHPLLDNRPVGAIGVVVIVADKGLAGSYNSNLLRVAHSFIDEKTREMQNVAPDVRANRERPVQLVTIGRKATDYFTKRGYPVVQNFMSIGVEAPYEQVRAASNAITTLYLTGQVDEVYICYTEFINTISQRPQAVKFLPIEPPSSTQIEDQEGVAPGKIKMGGKEFIFEPDAPQLLGVLLPRFVETRVYQLLMEAVASEFGARMTAMTNATKNAGEQIDRLTLVANRTRQAAITTELSEIVSGAEALRG
ncbi:MAG TPA: ATP synthase F1 subunit gamma [Abditibacteriaceae bacterium]|nr:ATP synthase F1 subunit gamma [Abditibacteriaceae bacterium]